MSTTTIPAFVTITVRYELTSDASDHLGADGTAVWSDALAAEISRRFPGAEVEVDTRWSSVAASRFDATLVTVDGVEVGAGKRHFGGVSVGADPDELDIAAWVAIEERLTSAERDAVERAYDAVA